MSKQEERKKRKIICVDVDDVCAKFSAHWLELYNKDARDNLSENDITDWSISSFVKPEYKEKIYDYVSLPNIYDNVEVVNGALEYTKLLKSRLNYRLIYVTFRSEFSASGRKYKWLNDNGFDVDEIDYIETNDKSLICADYMIDDNYDNVKNFNGEGFLYTKPWNKKFNHINRVNNWQEFYKILEARRR